MDINNNSTGRTIALNICKVAALSLVIGITTAQADPGKGETRAMMGNAMADSKVEIQKTAREASAVYSKFTNGPEAQISQAEIDRAKCVAIFPSLTNVAIVVGGRHGDGVVTCRTATGFSNVAPLDLSSATIGAQIGANQADLILLINSDTAKQRLEKGMLTLGADASVSAWTKDRKSVATGVSTEKSDVLAFAEDRGFFAGAALNGTQLKIDSDEVKNLYGKEIPVSGILSTANDNTLTGAARDLVEAITR
jgi:lipid-binding SYLF domain-containing protein